MTFRRYVCMFSVSWFDPGPTDPHEAGPDSYSSHWNVGHGLLSFLNSYSHLFIRE